MLLEDSFQKGLVARFFWEGISKGQLIKEDTPNNWIVAYSEPPITVSCQESQLKTVDPLFVPYLLAVENLASRYNLFTNELYSLEKNVLLNVGDKVDVLMEQEVIPTAGIVKYKGNLPRKDGVFFGIEILVSQYYVCRLSSFVNSYVLTTTITI